MRVLWRLALALLQRSLKDGAWGSKPGLAPRGMGASSIDGFPGVGMWGVCFDAGQGRVRHPLPGWACGNCHAMDAEPPRGCPTAATREAHGKLGKTFSSRKFENRHQSESQGIFDSLHLLKSWESR